jgi:phosphoribosylformimino-5-aminoimidazole carboxamide ribonucleotide (ProFAR) isomerase
VSVQHTIDRLRDEGPIDPEYAWDLTAEEAERAFHGWDEEREVDYVHDPDDYERAGTDAYTDDLRGGYA